MKRGSFIKAGLVMIGGVWVPKQQGATIIIRGPRVAAAAPAWTDSFSEGAIDDELIYGGSAWAYITHTISLPTGTCTKLRFKVAAYSTTKNVKLALYDSSHNFVASGAVSVDSTGVKEVSFAGAAVTAGNHSIALCSDAGYDDFRVSTLGSQSNASWYNFSQTYAGFPPGTRPANEADINEKIWFGAYIA